VKRSSNKCVAGFTVVEVLLVIAIISLLTTLGIPALQSAREAARRTQCANNQRQFGIAFLNFESQQGAFPAALTFRLQGPLNDAEVRSHSLISELLPYLEASGIAAQYQNDAYFCGNENVGVIDKVISTGICPSTPREDTVYSNHDVPSQWFAGSLKEFGKFFAPLDAKYSTIYQGAVTDYAVPFFAEPKLARALGYQTDKSTTIELRSAFSLPAPSRLILQFVTGSVEIGDRTRAADIIDGLSNTFLLTEDAGRPEHWRSGQRSYVREPLNSAWADPFTGIYIRDPGAKDGQCLVNCDNEENIYSFHPHGVNFQFADGHVAFLVDNIDAKVLLAYLTPNRGDNRSEAAQD
jgi:prepilin-type processing-associated H-X9-DG protein